MSETRKRKYGPRPNRKKETINTEGIEEFQFKAPDTRGSTVNLPTKVEAELKQWCTDRAQAEDKPLSQFVRELIRSTRDAEQLADAWGCSLSEAIERCIEQAKAN